MTQPDVAVDGVIYSYQRHGGVSRILSAVLPRLCALDDELGLELWTWKKLAQEVPEHARIVHRQIPQVPAPRRSRPAALQRRLRRAAAWGNERLRRRTVARSRAGIWHATLYWHPPAWRGRIVTTVYDLKEELYPELAGQQEKLLRYKRAAIEAADHILCISQTTRQDLISCYRVDEQKLSVMPLGFESRIFREDGAEDEDGDVTGLGIHKPFVLFVGRRDPFKNFDVLIEAYRRWPRHHEVDLVVAGPSLVVEERRHLADLGILEHVVLLPDVDEASLARLYRAAEALVYPSRYEGFGLPLLEAMACGCPLVAANIPSSLELAADVATFFETEEADSLVEALEGAVPEGRTSPRVAEGLKRSQGYSWDDAARITLETYRQV